jgi:hypothetical protein
MSTHPNKREVHAQAHELNEKRKECNEVILKRLTEYLRANPGMRFSQALINMDILLVRLSTNPQEEFKQIVNEYYTEPMEVLKRMK